MSNSTTQADGNGLEGAVLESAKSFGFMRSFHKQLSYLSDERAGRLVKAMGGYAFDGVSPTFSDSDSICTILWAGFKPVIDNSIKARTNGKRGGRPRKKKAEDATETENPPFNPPYENEETPLKTDRIGYPLQSPPIPSHPIPATPKSSERELTSKSSKPLDASDEMFVTTQVQKLRALGYVESVVRPWLEGIVASEGREEARAKVDALIHNQGGTVDLDTGEII